MEIFDGGVVRLMGPVAFKISGRKGASQAIGFLLGLCAIPMTLGPPIAGFNNDETGTFKISFLIVKDKSPEEEITIETVAVSMSGDLEANEINAAVQ